MWYANISHSELKNLTLERKITHRIVAWRIMVKVLEGTHDEIIAQSWEMRKRYYELKEKLEPRASEELSPAVFNPLSQDSKVIINQRTLDTLILRTKKYEKTFA